MAIVAKATNGGGDFIPAPEGQFIAVCCDVVDHGIVKQEWLGKTTERQKVSIVFQIGEAMDDGKPFTVRWYGTLTLDERGNLRAFLEQWRGQKFTVAELAEGFDVEKLIGANAVVQIVHAKKADKVYANINSVMKPMKGMKRMEITPDFVRRKDRTDVAATPAVQQHDEPPHPSQDESRSRWEEEEDAEEEAGLPF